VGHAPSQKPGAYLPVLALGKILDLCNSAVAYLLSLEYTRIGLKSLHKKYKKIILQGESRPSTPAAIGVTAPALTPFPPRKAGTPPLLLDWLQPWT